MTIRSNDAFGACSGSLMENILTYLLISDPFGKMKMLCFLLLLYVLHIAIARDLPKHRPTSKQTIILFSHLFFT